MNKEAFKKLAQKIVRTGIDEATAAHYAAIIGDTPMVDKDGNIVIKEDGKIVARLKIDVDGRQ